MESKNSILKVEDFLQTKQNVNVKDKNFENIMFVYSIESFTDIKIIKEKDYVTKPKKSGYSSYHMIVEVPVNIVGKIVPIKVEIQIRTKAMDFWSTLEHEISYKATSAIPKKVTKELANCAKIINKLDLQMASLYNRGSIEMNYKF